jgi:hypothetical protein
MMEIGEWVRVTSTMVALCALPTVLYSQSQFLTTLPTFLIVWYEITVPVKYGSDHKLVREIILTSANESGGD